MQYRTGTVTVVSGQQQVTGSGTLWSSNVSVGDLFKKKNESVIYEVASVSSDTVIQLSAKYCGSGEAGAEYQITRDFTPNLDLPEVCLGDRDWPVHLTQALRLLDSILAKYNRCATSFGTVTTTNATTVKVVDLFLEDNAVYSIEATVVGRCTAGSNIGKGAAYFLKGAYRRYSGQVATLIGSVSQTVMEDVSGWNSTIAVSGQYVRVTVTGGASDTMNWSGVIEHQHVT